VRDPKALYLGTAVTTFSVVLVAVLSWLLPPPKPAQSVGVLIGVFLLFAAAIATVVTWLVRSEVRGPRDRDALEALSSRRAVRSSDTVVVIRS